MLAGQLGDDKADLPSVPSGDGAYLVTRPSQVVRPHNRIRRELGLWRPSWTMREMAETSGIGGSAWISQIGAE
jgi:hypothetical protein